MSTCFGDSTWVQASRTAHHLRYRRAVLLLVVFLAAGTAQTEESLSKQVFDQAWSNAMLWESSDGEDFLALSGRLQADSYWFSADKKDVPPGADDNANDALWRRFRFGFKSEFGDGFVVQLEADLDLNNNLDDMYNRLTDAYVGYAFSQAAQLKFLKQSVGYTLDGATSSKKLLTLQRNNVTNNLWATDEYFSGLQFSGTLNKRWSYKAGVFSGDDDEEIGFDDVGYFSLLSLGYNFAERLQIQEATVRVDYVYNDKDDDNESDVSNNGTPDFNHTTTLATLWDWGRWGLRTDISAGQGMADFAEQSDVWGVAVMPFYSFNEHHQVVLRYTYMDSDDDNGIRLGRYERELVSGRGDEYKEIYLGYNLFFYGQKLKWQTGLQYTDMSDAADDGGEYTGWGLTTGLRMYWY